MKKLLFIVMQLAAVAGFAQSRDVIFADLSISQPGASVTYNRQLAKRFSLGGGMATYYWSTGRIKLMAAAFADVRPHWQIGRSQILLPIDIGIAFYSKREPLVSYATTISTLGMHLAWGLGYCYRVNSRGMGPYITFMLKGYSYTERNNNAPPGTVGVFDANSLLSVGVKF